MHMKIRQRRRRTRDRRWQSEKIAWTRCRAELAKLLALNLPRELLVFQIDRARIPSRCLRRIRPRNRSLAVPKVVSRYARRTHRAVPAQTPRASRRTRDHAL